MADQVRIKPDPEAAASPLADDDMEDAGDLEFYDRSVPGDPMGTMYLARLPTALWDAWSELDDDAEIQIGTIRQFNEVDAQGAAHPRLQMLLRPDLAQHQGLPKEYNLDITDPVVNNTYVFTEQDLAGYAAKNKAKADAIAAGIPAHLLKQKTERQPYERGKKGAPPPKKSIPKRTTIAGRIRHELSGTPVDNVESRIWMEQRTSEAMKPKAQTTLLSGMALGVNSILHAGSQRAHEAFEGFIKTAPKVEKAKKMDNKTTRMAENDLIDQINLCFSYYSYYSMRALRARLRQPEAYLRETLDKVANLNRSGPFANLYSIKPEFRDLVAQKANKALPGADTVAPMAEDDGAEPYDEVEEDDVKMEDVNFNAP